MRGSVQVTLIVAVIVSAATVAHSQAPVRYVYDELGRLTTVVDTTGDAATYHYDAVGNLTAITRTNAGTVAIFAFSPTAGAIGSTVTVSGMGFSATPSLNAVTFNGTAATISTASTTELVVIVPPGATTGTLTVTTPVGTANASPGFTVTSGAGAPTISGISPTVGVVGATVTVSGTNFEALAAKNKLSMNLTYSAPTGVTPTEITTNVPVGGTSGRITVSTPFGMATSADDFFVPPAPYVVSDVAVTDRTPIGTDKVVTIGTAGKIGLVVFDVAAGERASLRISNATIAHSVVSIRDPYARIVGTTTVTSSGAFLEPFRAPVSGTYTVMVDPTNNDTGSVTLRAYDVPPDLSGTIVPGGSPVPFTIAAPGQNGRWAFAGTAGQQVSVRVTNSTIALMTVGVVAPDGTILSQTTSSFADTLVLPSTGGYSLFVDPWNLSTGDATLTLYDVPPDASGTIVADSVPVTLSMNTPGQNGFLTFTGTAGQRVSLTINPGPLSSVTVRKPDGSTLASGTVGVLVSFIEPQTLPTTGTYTIFVNPIGANTGNVTLALHDVPADVSGTITIDGAAETVTTTTPGQNGSLSFSGAAGQRVSLWRSSGPGGTVSIRRANGTTLASTSISILAGFIEPVTLPAAETYVVFVDYAGQNTGSISLQLFDVPADVTGSVAVGGSALGVTISAPGQNAAITFTGTSAQQVTVRITGNTIGSTTVRLRRPDGTQMTATTSSASNFNLATQTLPTTGTYTIDIDPASTGTGTLNVSVTTP